MDIDDLEELSQGGARWSKIEEGDNWGELYYVYEGEKSPENALVLYEGRLVTVQFADGEAKSLPLVVHKRHASYLDHGQLFPTEFDTDVFGVEVSVHGSVAFIPLTELKLKYLSVPRKKDEHGKATT